MGKGRKKWKGEKKKKGEKRKILQVFKLPTLPFISSFLDMGFLA